MAFKIEGSLGNLSTRDLTFEQLDPSAVKQHAADVWQDGLAQIDLEVFRASPQGHVDGSGLADDLVDDDKGNRPAPFPSSTHNPRV